LFFTAVSFAVRIWKGFDQVARGENIYKRKDGRWEGRYPKGRKADGRIHYGYIYGYSYRIVKERLIEKKAEQIKLPSLSIRQFQGVFAQWVNYWLAEIMRSKIKESTYASYTNKFQLYILPLLGKLSLERITAADIEQVISVQQQKLSINSIHIIFGLMNSCFEAAKERNYISINPCRQVHLPKKEKRKVQALTRAQQALIEKESMKTSKGLPIILALETGMRIGEICALKWNDIDFERSVLEVKKTKQRIAVPFHPTNRTKIVETAPKTITAARIIPLSKKIKALLLRVQAQAVTPYVVESNGHDVEPRTVSYRFEQIKNAVGLKTVTFHALRHTFATRCVEAGANIAAISSLLGHSSIKLTLDTYTSSFIEEQRAVIEKFSENM
jgi:integrase